MITLTESAVAHIQTMLKNKGENAAFRLSIKKTGCSGYMYVPEIVNAKNENDIEQCISNLLMYFDASTVELIKGTTVDYIQKSLGVSQLVFTHPQAKSVCGCGESFKLSDQS
jgi:iron-sulfur cluster assembly protein